jgi:hypothetical protein
MGLFSNLFALLLVASCASFMDVELKEPESPGYQNSRQLDDRSLKSGFLER